MKFEALTRKELESEIVTALVYDTAEAYIAEAGWEDWMEQFTEAADGEECTEAEIAVIEKVQREIWEEARNWFLFEEYRDKAGIGFSKAFDNEGDAIKYAESEWNHLSDHDKKSYTEDAFSYFRVVTGYGYDMWNAFE